MTQNYLQQSDFIALKAYKTKNCSDCLSSDIIPCANRKYNLGSAQYAFNEIHAKKIFVDANTLVIGGGVTLSANGTKLLVNGKEITSVFETLLTLLSTGQANQVLSSDGAGGLFWQTGGGGSAGDLQSVCDNGRVYQRSDATGIGDKIQTTIITPSISTIDKKNATLTDSSSTTYSHTIDTTCFYISDDGTSVTSETGFFFNLIRSSSVNPMLDNHVFTKIIADVQNITIGGVNKGDTRGTGLNLLIADDKNLSINGEAGLANQFLMTNGASVPPTWETVDLQKVVTAGSTANLSGPFSLDSFFGSNPLFRYNFDVDGFRIHDFTDGILIGSSPIVLDRLVCQAKTFDSLVSLKNRNGDKLVDLSTNEGLKLTYQSSGTKTTTLSGGSLVTDALALSVNGSYGTSGQVLTSNGTTSSWQTPAVPSSFLGATGTCPLNSWVSVDATNNALPSVNTQIGYTYSNTYSPVTRSTASGSATLFSQTVPAGVWIIHCKVTIGNPSATTTLTVTGYSLEILQNGSSVTKISPYTTVGSLFTMNPNNTSYTLTISHVATLTTSQTIAFFVGYSMTPGNVIQFGNYTNDFVRITRIA